MLSRLYTKYTSQQLDKKQDIKAFVKQCLFAFT